MSQFEKTKMLYMYAFQSLKKLFLMGVFRIKRKEGKED